MVLFSGFSITFVERRCKVILQKPENVGMRKNGNKFFYAAAALRVTTKPETLQS